MRRFSGVRPASRTSCSRPTCTPAPPATARPTSARSSATTPTAPSPCSSPAPASGSRRSSPKARRSRRSSVTPCRSAPAPTRSAAISSPAAVSGCSRASSTPPRRTVLLGGIYALIAVGLTLIFGIMRVVNFAHGEFLMLGMYLAFFAFTLEGLDPYVVLLISIPIFYGVGWLVYVLIMRGVIHASHNVQIFTTVGLSTALQNVALVRWTGDFRVIPPWHSSVVLRVAGTAFNLSQVVAWAVAVALTIALFAFMKLTHTGRVMLATAQDRDATRLICIG